MTNRINATLTAHVQQQLSAAVDLLTRRLGGNLMAIHLYGSAVEGGLRPYSDLDLLVTLRAPLDNAQRASLMPALLALSAPPGAADGRRALEVTLLVYAQLVPWRYPPVRELQFGEWQREDIEAGIYEPAQQDADIAILLTKARHASVALVGDEAARCTLRCRRAICGGPCRIRWRCGRKARTCWGMNAISS